jgi:probable addiction module antidote protein
MSIEKSTRDSRKPKTTRAPKTGETRANFAAGFRQQLYEKLRDPAYAATYLREAFENDDETEFMVALADVVRAQGLSVVAERAGLHRVSVSKLLRPDRRPAFTSVHRLLEACGVDLTVRAV